ncbi:MAG: hypothetical protein E7214_15575 [Clostridium sp.]|nr:hypothetical protein [Clostridium sp.]
MTSNKKGSLILEVAVSICIVLLIITIGVSIDKLIVVNGKNKNKFYTMEESLYSIISEIKYNVNYKELKDLLEDKELSFKYNDEFLKKLTSTNLLDMTKEKEDEGTVKIIKLSESEEEEYMELKIIIEAGKNTIEGKVIKSYWMDYV